MAIEIIIDLDELDIVKEISDEAVARALELCGAKWETDAKKLAPVDTGRLRNSIEHHPEGTDTMIVETDVNYAIYQEMGTSRMKAQPFMKPSGEGNVTDFKNIIENELKK